MAKFQITLHKNTGVTAEQAPYLGNYVSKGQIPYDEILKNTATGCGMPIDEVDAMLNGSVAAIIKRQIIQATRMDFGFAVFLPIITGGFATSDAAFDPAKNTYELAMSFNKDIRNALVNVRPEIVSEEGATKVKLGNVFSKANPRPYGVLRLGEVARGTGEHLVFTDDGAALKLEDTKTGAEIEIPLSGVTSETSNVFEFTVPQNMLPGDYKVWVLSRGGDAEGAVQSVSYRVKVIAAPEPTGPHITKVTSDGGVEDDHLAAKKNHVLGTGLALGEGDHVYLRLIDTDGTVLEDNSQDHRVASSTDTEITSGDSGFWPDDSEYPDGEWNEEGRTVKLRVVKADGTSAERRVYLDDGE